MPSHPAQKHLLKQGVGLVAYTYNPRTWEVESGGSGIQGHPRQHNLFEVSWWVLHEFLPHTHTKSSKAKQNQNKTTTTVKEGRGSNGATISKPTLLI